MKKTAQQNEQYCSEITELEEQIHQKDYMLERMNMKLLKFKEVVATVELRVTKYKVKKPNDENFVFIFKLLVIS